MRKVVATTREEYSEMLVRNVEQGYTSLCIASFRMSPLDGVWQTLDVLNARTTKARILIGLSTLESSKAKGYQDPVLGLMAGYAVNFPHMKFRWMYESHLKCWIFRRKAAEDSTVLVGGRNLNWNDWPDITVEMQGSTFVKPIQRFFNQLWKQAREPAVTPLMRDVVRRQLEKRT